jgi:23S rRNA (cytosine1962-C5)-methyltransferase
MNDYELLDFGGGRKLERFGPYMLDRPSPAAQDATPRTPELWSAAHARYSNKSRRPDGASSGEWVIAAKPLSIRSTWNLDFGGRIMELRLTPFGHIGVFPEQRENWDWIVRKAANGGIEGRPLKVLNLFAYTGGATLAAAAAGAEVTHVDAARNTVAWARRNAELSGMADAPIRWIAEDARKFVARELRRGNAYDAVILDPPSYGHGVKGEAWKIDEHLPPLLADCARLTADRRAFFLVTSHSPDYGARELRQLLTRAGIGNPDEFEAFPLDVSNPDGRRLASGFAARWERS